MPKRIQIAKSEDASPLPDNTVLVASSVWSSPIRPNPKNPKREVAKYLVIFRTCLEAALRGQPIPKVVDGYSVLKKKRNRVRRIAENLHQLRGKDLACRCTADYPCHADVLLEFANVPLVAEPIAAEAPPVEKPKPRTRRKKAEPATA